MHQAQGTNKIYGSHVLILFRESSLKQSLRQPFNGNDLIRFSQIDKLKRFYGVPPREDDVETTRAKISAYSTFSYSPATGYKLTPHDAIRLQTWKEDAIEANRLFRGRVNQIVHLTFVISSRMVREYLAYFRENGTISWNRIIARTLSIVARRRLYCSYWGYNTLRPI